MMGWCPNDGNECHHDGYWDDAECDGYCLMEEIAEILEIEDEQ